MSAKVKSSRTSSDQSSLAMRVAKATAKNGAKISMATARKVGQKISERIPEDAKRGFRDGRKAGHDLVRHAPYAAGTCAGFSFGASEAIVELAAKPVNTLVELGIGLGTWTAWKLGIVCQDEGEVEEAELA